MCVCVCVCVLCTWGEEEVFFFCTGLIIKFPIFVLIVSVYDFVVHPQNAFLCGKTRTAKVLTLSTNHGLLAGFDSELTNLIKV